MLTLTIEGKSVGELQEGIVMAMRAFHVPLQMVGTLPVPLECSVAADEPAPAKEKAKRGRPAKETPPEMVVTKETPGPEKTDTFLPEAAKPAPATTGATYESMKQALQKLAGTHKSNEEGMAAVKKLLGTFSITMVRDVPAEKYQTVQDAAMNAISEMGTGAAADPFAPK